MFIGRSPGKRIRPVFNRLHSALVPTDQEDLVRRLREVNIDVVEYGLADGHADAWRALRQLHDSYSGSSPAAPPIDPTFGHGPLHHFIAFAHTQAVIRPHAQPITDIARDGLVASFVSSASEVFEEEEIRIRVASLLRLSPAEAGQVVATSIDRLVGRGVVRRDGSKVLWIGPKESSIDKDLNQLTDSVVRRMRVRQGVRATDQDRDAARALIERVLLTRAWDLGAQFARGHAGWNVNTGSIVESSLVRLPASNRPTNTRAVAKAIQSLLNGPERGDAAILTRLGRIAFGVQLVLASPRQTLFHQYALPRRVYLDASVLLPFITAGHPLEPAYRNVVGRLASAARQAGTDVSVAVGVQFLNEVLAHRQRAVEMVRSGSLEDYETLRRHIQFYSGANTNVFVGAYGTKVASEMKPLGFAEFLGQVAPYADEDQLAAYLEAKGVETVEMQFKDEFNREFVSVLNPLQEAYGSIDREKAAILVWHEAQQMTQLRIDVESGVSSVFVTADRKLRRAVAGTPELQALSGLLVSHLGLIALTDVMVGIDGADVGSLARMMWLSTERDEEQVLVEFFINLGLRKYDESMSSDLQSLAEQCAKEAEKEARSQRLDLSATSPDLEKTVKFLDRFENQFYERWHEAIRRRHREE